MGFKSVRENITETNVPIANQPGAASQSGAALPPLSSEGISAPLGPEGTQIASSEPNSSLAENLANLTIAEEKLSLDPSIEEIILAKLPTTLVVI